ncbi:hypothetical protein [Sphingomonas endophytica]|uniref:hypothetical protein n=1 Tax=Sphingomonas endophytica TaxID=869719 RepID=UPI000AE00803|nr:hypothetical protein [Sphingomonas endophytica]
MQNRYAGDIGDYLKFAILRAAAVGHRTGVAWWLYPDESHNGDGRHVGYLARPDVWRAIDPVLFDKLREMVEAGERSVRSIEALRLLEHATYHSDRLDFDGAPNAKRQARAAWFDRLINWSGDRDLLFLDPDNGFAPAGYSPGSAKAGKSVTVDEVARLARNGRPVIVYHHQTRRPGGHHAELEYWAERLMAAGCAKVDAVRAAPFSARALFVINGSDAMRVRLADAVARWRSPKITWHPSA